MLAMTTTFLRSGKTSTKSTYVPYFDILIEYINDSQYSTYEDVNAVIEKFYGFSGDVSLIFLTYMYENYNTEFITYVNSDENLDMSTLEKSAMEMLTTFNTIGKSKFDYDYYIFVMKLFKNKKHGLGFIHEQLENTSIANEIYENIDDFKEYFDLKYYENLYVLKDIKFVLKNYDSDFSDSYTNFIINKSLKLKTEDIYKKSVDIILKFIRLNNKYKHGFIDYCIKNNNKRMIYDYNLKECFIGENIPYFNNSNIDETFYWLDNFSYKYLKEDFNSKMYKLLESKIKHFEEFLSYFNLFIERYPEILESDYILDMVINNISGKKDVSLFINLHKKILRLESMVDTTPSSKVNGRDEF